VASPSFRWEAAPHHQRDAVICDVPGVGRLLARRRSPRSTTFVGYIDGDHAIPATPSLERAKAALETVALQRLNKSVE
jgi:hypothetical protein